MKQWKRFFVGATTFACMALYAISAYSGGIGDFLKGVQKSLTGEGVELSQEKIVEGLKEALQIGTGNAVQAVSQAGGYYQNPDIRIPLPETVQKAEKLLRAVGYGPQVDAFEKSMNRAAEKAAPEAKSLFWDAIKQMDISDAQRILKGEDDEATRYFKEQTYGRLQEIFQPIVRGSMSQVGVTDQYQQLDQKVSQLPMGESFRFDLDKYVTNEALDGLFHMVAQEEKKIRQDPAARVTDLLKEVFSER